MPDQRAPRPRIPPVTDPPPEVADMLATGWLHDGKPLSVPRILAHHPRLLRRFSVFAGLFLMKSELPVRDRELLTLRSTLRAGTEYYFGHHVLVAEQSGISDDVLRRMTEPAEKWSGPDELLVRVADEMVDHAVLTDRTYDDLSRRYNAAQLMEAILIPGFYRMVAGFVNTLGVEREPGVPGWPADVAT
jgi:alkylhydroperoxidase family enzyme